MLYIFGLIETGRILLTLQLKKIALLNFALCIMMELPERGNTLVWISVFSAIDNIRTKEICPL